jgi:hypothetical protein
MEARATSGKVKRPGTLWVLARATGAWRRNPRLAAVAGAALVIQQLFSAGFALSIKAIIEDVNGHEHHSGLPRLLMLLSVGFVLTALAAVAGEGPRRWPPAGSPTGFVTSSTITCSGSRRRRCSARPRSRS